jgi:Uma2 family endonuclease
MLARVLDVVSPGEYLRRERQAEGRSEYHAGQVFAMAGASRRHNRIVTNLSAALSVQLQSRPCNNYASDMRVRIGNAERYVYPDIVATCGREEFEDDWQDVLLNPLLIIEVLSPSTEAYDRGDKFRHYQTIASLREYVLVSQDRRCFEVYRKQPDGRWLDESRSMSPLILRLESVDCVLTEAEVYAKVEEGY